MASTSRVVWSEGLFLRPQHFQQQERYLERYIESRCHPLTPHAWGVSDIEIERDLLAIGKFGLTRVSGIYPDGTPFRLPDDDPLPTPLEIGAQVRDQAIHLALPLRRADAADMERAATLDGLARYHVEEWQAKDVTATSNESVLLEVGAMRPRLLLASEVVDAYACVPIAHIVECLADRRIVLDDRFMPTALHVRAAGRLNVFLGELVGLVHQRGEALRGVVTSTSRAGAAEIADFLTLQILNRYEPLLAHHLSGGHLHPEALYRLCLELAGELATFADERRPPAFPAYQHGRLRESFEPVIVELRRLLALDRVRSAVPIPLELKAYGIRVATVADLSLFDTAVFYLGARADLPPEELRQRFPKQLRIAPVARIAEIVNLGLSGVTVSPLPVAPPRIPFHAGFAYFELDQSHELWAQLRSSGGMAVQLQGEWPGLAMELWAVRG